MISGSDWVSFGVLYYKSCQTSKAGNSYTLCKLSDLQSAGRQGCQMAIAKFLDCMCLALQA